MCTVVLDVRPGEPVRILALRDEFVDRDFDDPGRWWPEQPDAVGGRDRAAGGTWCASDVMTGATALLVNRTERFDGTPSRGLLPLAALARGEEWTEVVDHRTMASFNLVLATPQGATVWVWDAVTLRRVDLTEGTHVVTSSGVDAADAKTRRFAPEFDAAEPAGWLGVVGGCVPNDDESALVVRRDYAGHTYATVFGQAITASAGAVTISSTRTPWLSGTWRERSWTPRDESGPDSGEGHLLTRG